MSDEKLDKLSNLELAVLELKAWRELVMPKYRRFCDDIGAK